MFVREMGDFRTVVQFESITSDRACCLLLLLLHQLIQLVFSDGFESISLFGWVAFSFISVSLRLDVLLFRCLFARSCPPCRRSLCFSFLGHSKSGVYVCKYADVSLRHAVARRTSDDATPLKMLIFKVKRGEGANRDEDESI